jgi:hypothetical protein
MNVLSLGLGLIAGASLAATTVVSAQQEDVGKMTTEQQAMMAEWAKISAPSDAHKHLDYFVGKWKTKTSMYMGGPGSTPMVSDGKSEMKWVLDGRFIMDMHEGTMMGQPYNGIGMTGYDNYRNMYVSSWYSNQGTNILAMGGARNPKTQMFTYYGEMDEPSLKVIGRMVKYVTTIADKDHYTFDIIDLHAGDDYKVISIAYERVK